MHSDNIKASAIVLVPDRLQFDYFAKQQELVPPHGDGPCGYQMNERASSEQAVGCG